MHQTQSDGSSMSCKKRKPQRRPSSKTDTQHAQKRTVVSAAAAHQPPGWSTGRGVPGSQLLGSYKGSTIGWEARTRFTMEASGRRERALPVRAGNGHCCWEFCLQGSVDWKAMGSWRGHTLTHDQEVKRATGAPGWSWRPLTSPRAEP